MKKTLKEKFEKLSTKYLKAFIKKHGYDFDYWIGGDSHGIASFSEQYFFSLEDICFDIDNELELGLIFRWQDDAIDYHMTHPDKATINLKSYSMGLRFKDLKK